MRSTTPRYIRWTGGIAIAATIPIAVYDGLIGDTGVAASGEDQPDAAPVFGADPADGVFAATSLDRGGDARVDAIAPGSTVVVADVARLAFNRSAPADGPTQRPTARGVRRSLPAERVAETGDDDSKANRSEAADADADKDERDSTAGDKDERDSTGDEADSDKADSDKADSDKADSDKEDFDSADSDNDNDNEDSTDSDREERDKADSDKADSDKADSGPAVTGADIARSAGVTR
jgi:segregation and condensation protein B